MSSRIRFIDEASSNLDGFLFVSAFTIGALWILIFRLWLNLPATVALIGPLCVLISYAVLLLKGNFSLREDRAADNLYYLGFLYTLVSLGVGLYRYKIELSGVENIISDLGVGLTTTIVGLFLRIVFLQLRVDPDEVGEDAKVELSRAIESFRAQVLQLTEVSNLGQAVFSQQYEESSEALRKTTERFSATVERLDESTQSIGHRIDAVQVPEDLFVDKFTRAASILQNALELKSEQIRDIDFDLSPSVSKVRASVEEAGDAIESLSSKLTSIEFDPTEIRESIRSAAEQIAGQITGLLPAVDQLNNALEGHSARMQRSSSSIEAFSSAIDGLAEKEGGVTDVAEHLAKSVSHLSEFSSSLSELPRQLEHSVEQVAAFQRMLESQTGTLDERFSAVNSEVESVQLAATQLSGGLREITDQFSRTIDELVKAANRPKSPS
jgi:methyl-accepting chemotaxis protein